MRLGALPLQGDGWREQHDAILWRIVEDAREMGIATKPNVYGIFAACIPQVGRDRIDALPLRKRQGLVPDLMLIVQWDGRGPARRLLFELKTLHFGSSTYPQAAERCFAVGRRARGLPASYAAKARRVDQQFCSTPSGQTGPVETRLRSFEPVKGLVFGAWAEASPDVHTLLRALAAAGSLRHHQSMGAASPSEAHGALAWLIKRRWAMTAAREAARLTLARLEFVGRGAAAALRRRKTAESIAARMRRESCWQHRCPIHWRQGR